MHLALVPGHALSVLSSLFIASTARMVAGEGAAVAIGAAGECVDDR
jgi:hypothetical protein